MQAPADLHPRAQRIVAGNGNVEDVRRLFKWARTLLKPGDPVRDVGDFDAHPEKRDRGLTWDTGRAFCALMRIGPIGQVFGVKPSVNDLKVAVASSVAFAGLVNDPEQSGFETATLIKNIKSAAAKISTFDGKTETFSSPLTNNEEIVYRYIRQRRSVPLAFTAFSLTRDLFNLLEKHQVLKESDRKMFYSIEKVVNIFVISIMHLAVIDLKGVPGRAWLQAGTSSTHFDKLVVFLHYEMPENVRGPNVVRIYASDHGAKSSTSSELHSSTDGKFEFMKDWNVPLEIDETGLLAPLAGCRVADGPIRPLPGLQIV